VPIGLVLPLGAGKRLRLEKAIIKFDVNIVHYNAHEESLPILGS
jgi:hypothetical protein